MMGLGGRDGGDDGLFYPASFNFSLFIFYFSLILRIFAN
jgi:hypothetical protein